MSFTGTDTIPPKLIALVDALVKRFIPVQGEDSAFQSSFFQPSHQSSHGEILSPGETVPEESNLRYLSIRRRCLRILGRYPLCCPLLIYCIKH
jgi:hypothetical protein